MQHPTTNRAQISCCESLEKRPNTNEDAATHLMNASLKAGIQQQLQRSAGSMAERLTTNQEVPGSTPGWIGRYFDMISTKQMFFFFVFYLVNR